MPKTSKLTLLLSTLQLLLLGITIIVLFFIVEVESYINYHQKYCNAESIQEMFWPEIKQFINNNYGKSKCNFTYKTFSPSRGFGVCSGLFYIKDKKNFINSNFDWEIIQLNNTCYIGIVKNKQKYCQKYGFNSLTTQLIRGAYPILYLLPVAQFILLLILLKRIKDNKTGNTVWLRTVFGISLFTILVHPVVASLFLYMNLPVEYEYYQNPNLYNKLYSNGMELLATSPKAQMRLASNRLSGKYGIKPYFVSKPPFKNEFVRFDLGKFNYIYVFRNAISPEKVISHIDYKIIRPGMYFTYYKNQRAYQLSVYHKIKWYFFISWGLLILLFFIWRFRKNPPIKQ